MKVKYIKELWLNIKPWKRRLTVLLILTAIVSLGVAIILKTFNDNIVFFYSPTDLIEKSISPSNKLMRVGGIVKEGSINKTFEGVTEFFITDYKNELKITYKGILPNLFKENQSSIAYGKLMDGNIFIAEELLAKHDENYIPKEVSDSLIKNRK